MKVRPCRQCGNPDKVSPELLCGIVSRRSTVAVRMKASLMHGGKAMPEHAENGGGRHRSRWRIAVWGTAVLLLLLPRFAMQVTDEVDWGVADFAIFGAMLLGAGGTYEFAARKTGDPASRAAVGVALAAAFLLVWMNLAVGIIGSEDNPANLMYGGVLAVGMIGAVIARFQPHGMARARWSRRRSRKHWLP